MNKEDLFIGFGNLDEDLLRRSEQGGQNMNKKRNISKIVKYGSIAACLVVVLGVGIGAFVKTSIINQEPEKTKDVIEEILNIDCSISEQQETEQRVSESEVNTEIQDAPADESTYQEASDYSAELTDLQNRITQAMINKELPFVTSCGIYENPDRVKTVVNTEDEDLLAKLRAFDTTGELLEIVYSSRANGLE